MRFRGRHIDPVALWENYVDFPANMQVDEDEIYLPKVICPNPEHDTYKRHFQINVRDGLVHCFARCGISGSFTHAISMIEGVDERAARKVILKHQRTGFHGKLHVQKKSTKPSRPTAPIQPVLLSYDSFVPEIGLEYLESRGITGESIAAWNIGWCLNEKRIVVPARDETGTTRFLVKRAVMPRQNPKYLYAPEKSLTGWGKTDVLFGACQIDPGMIRSRGLVLVEGSLDVIKFHQLGFPNTGGILGTGISKRQRQIIARMRPTRIYLAFDKDSAGIYNVESASWLLKKYPLFVCRFPKGKDDPAQLETRGEVEKLIDRAIPLASFERQLQRKGITLRTRQMKRGVGTVG